MEVSQTRPRLRGAEGEDDAGEGRTGGQPGRWGGRAGRAKRRRRRATRRETTPFLPSLSTRLSAAACSAQRIGKRGLEREDEAKPATSLAAPPRFSSSSPGKKARAVRSPPPPPLKPPPRSAPRFPWRGQPWRALPEKRGLGSKALINEQENQILPFLIREERGPNQWKRRLLDADHRRHRRHYKAACSYFFSHFYATEMTKSVIGPAFFTPCSNIIRAITAHLPIIPFLVAEKKNLPKNRNWRSHI